VKLLGRCSCGVILRWVAANPDAHLACFGLRWCGVCGEAAAYREECRPCKRRRNRVNGPRWLLKPKNRAKRNEYSRQWEASRRRGDAPTYQRQKASKRQRYAERRAA
jgi:hypothetical protein